MDFKTTLPTKKLETPIDLADSIMLAGSCFAEHIGIKLERYRFPAMINPFGIIFNPVSLCNNLQNCLEKKLPSNDLFIQNQEVWYHYQLHTDFAALDLESLKNKIENQWKATQQFLNNSKYLILTFGTAWVYRLNKNQALVANCHKIPSKAFKKELLKIKEIKSAFTDLFNILPKNIEVILTVSPVRHLKDTLELNSVSKATLRLACHELQAAFENVHYFPAFELLIDDLRDYRFFTADMLHPTPQAIDYVWEQFLNSCISAEAQEFIQYFEKIILQIEHRPNAPQTAAHQKFLQKLLMQLNAIKKVKVDDLIREVENRIAQN